MNGVLGTLVLVAPLVILVAAHVGVRVWRARTQPRLTPTVESDA